ncbi:MAG: hypothetical protein M0R80_14830 [Proteobacteria bacterium]|jgi:hypothetical protein|nr:hypothetical protein [Pseudomonadota bacterium]
MTRLVRSAFFWFAALLTLGELAAWRTLPYRLVPTADVAIRNPLKHRGWPEYLDASEGGRPLVVLISNSQGVGAEVDDPHKIYAAALRRHLSAKGYAFENWSMGGLRTTEVELLTLEAARRRAVQVLMILTVNNFDPPARVDLKFPFSDLTLVAGSPAHWTRLSGTRFMARSSFEDLAVAFVELSSSLARSRLAVTDLVAARVPLNAQPLIVGREVRPGPRLDGLRDPDVSMYFPSRDLTEQELGRRRGARRGKVQEWVADQADLRLETFRAVYPGIRARLAESGTSLTWVWNPIAPSAAAGDALAARDRFIEAATTLIEDSGATCHDMTGVIEPEHFETLGHFDEDGHREFAQVLLPVVDAALRGGGRAP